MDSKDRAQQYHPSKFCGLLVLKPTKRSIINIRHSICSLFQQAEFHISAAADRERPV
jgi:hypothetical protein